MGRDVDPGSLKQWVTIYRRSGETRGDAGEVSPEFAPIEGRPCRIENLSAAVVFSAAATGSRATVKVTMRLDELTETLRPLDSQLKDDDVSPPIVWNVTDVRPHPDRAYVDVYAALEGA